MIKKILFAAAFTFTGMSAFAQSNGGFESWASTFSEPQEPVGWITANVFASPFVSTLNPTSAYKDSLGNKFAGSYAMKLKTVVLVNNPDPTTIPDTIGVAIEGSVTLFPSFAIVDRIPYTARPNAIHFAAKYTPNGLDTSWVYMELTKWNTSLMRRDTIGFMGMMIPPSSNFVVYTPPIIYYTNHMNQFPDSLALAFSSSSNYTPKPGSLLWADDIYFTGWNGVQDLSSASISLSAFPNPAKEMITISTDAENAASLKVFDCIGKTIGTFEMNNGTYGLNTSMFMPGNYFYSVIDKNGTVLGGNTFTITK